MYKLVALLAIVAVASAATFEIGVMRLFAQFKADHGKTYESPDEETQRFAVFAENLAYINQHNAEAAAGQHGYTLGVNEFSDLTHEEFKKFYLPSKYNRTSPRNDVHLDTVTEGHVDWRTKNAVTHVKNQGQCGSCWSFSTTGSVEGANAIANGKLVSLSEQELCDCSHSFGNQGCSGGLMDNAFKYIISNGGLNTEEDYPYTARDGTCNKAKEAKKVVRIKSYSDVPQNDEHQLAAAVAKGPVSVAIEADKPAFQSYRSGVFDDASCGTQLDHGVLIVGYTDDYWIVKNSWGASWGDEGYIMMKRGVSKEGICGIAMQPSYPKAEHAGSDFGPSPSASHLPSSVTGPDGSDGPRQNAEAVAEKVSPASSTNPTVILSFASGYDAGFSDEGSALDVCDDDALVTAFLALGFQATDWPEYTTKLGLTGKSFDISGEYPVALIHYLTNRGYKLTTSAIAGPIGQINGVTNYVFLK